MKIAPSLALAAATVLLAAPTAVSADSYWEVEAARANARAGGPTNARDAELLERYGCLSGTRSGFCERLDHGGPRAYRAPYRGKKHRAQR